MSPVIVEKYINKLKKNFFMCVFPKLIYNLKAIIVWIMIC